MKFFEPKNARTFGLSTFSRTNVGQSVGQVLRVFGTLAVLGGLWQFAAFLVAKPFLPGPGVTFARFIELWWDGGLGLHTFVSARRVILAVFLALVPALALGIAAGRNAKIDAFLAPFLYLFHPIPKIAFLPLVILFFGLGEEPKIFLIFLVVFTQLVFSVRDAAKRTPESLSKSLSSLGAGRFATFFHLLLPQVLPELFTALRISLGAGIAVLFFSETFATVEGLGWFVMDAWTRVNYVDLYAAILALGLLGIVGFVIIDLMEAFFCRWKT